MSILFADDNFGNIMSVLPPEKQHPAGAGIYYHVDCELDVGPRSHLTADVGFPRAYKWINTINMAKSK